MIRIAEIILWILVIIVLLAVGLYWWKGTLNPFVLRVEADYAKY